MVIAAGNCMLNRPQAHGRIVPLMAIVGAMASRPRSPHRRSEPKQKPPRLCRTGAVRGGYEEKSKLDTGSKLY